MEKARKSKGLRSQNEHGVPISSLESEIRTLESSSVLWEYLLPWFTAIVAFGVFMEFWTIWRERREDMEAWRRGIISSPARPSNMKLVIEILSLIFIMVGIVGELGVGVKITSINGTLRIKSGELRSKSDQLVAILAREAEQLRTTAESERLARVELEDSIAWRRVPLDKRLSIAARLGSYGGQLAWLTYNMNDVESNDFGVDIAETLKLAHWTPSEPEALLKMFEGPVNLGTNKLPRGVVVTSTPDSSSENAARALVQELVNAGFDAISGTPVPLGTSPGQAVGIDIIRAAGSLAGKRPTVFISVEPRPDGPQGNAKLRSETKKKQTNTAKTN